MFICEESGSADQSWLPTLFACAHFWQPRTFESFLNGDRCNNRSHSNAARSACAPTARQTGINDAPAKKCIHSARSRRTAEGKKGSDNTKYV